MISIIIPYYNDSKYIAKLIEQIKHNNLNDNYEILIIDGKSNNGSRKIIDAIAKGSQNIKIIDNEKHITPCAVNIGIKASVGEYIILLSAHSGVAYNYIQTLVDKSKQFNADVIGSIGKMETLKDNDKAVSIKCVLSSRFGVGNAMYRIGVDKITEVDTVAYGCYRRDVFERFGLFNENLVRNQDLEFNKRVKNHNGKIYLTPDTYFVYYTRDNYKDFYKNNFENGYWSIITPYILKEGKSESLRHYVPCIFVTSILVSLILSIFLKKFLSISIGIILIYLLFVIGNSISIKWKRNRKATIGNLIIAFITLHFSYGLGSLKGFFDILRGKYKFERPNR